MLLTGSDFIKTSTGKESVNATYPVAIVMVRAIRDYFLRTGHKVRLGSSHLLYDVCFKVMRIQYFDSVVF